jgi:hypothetical protein
MRNTTTTTTTTTRVPTLAERADDERRTARRMYRDARRYDKDAVLYARHAALMEREGRDPRAVRDLADKAPGRAAKNREWARAANARARRYDELDAEQADRWRTVELDTSTHDDKAATALIARLAASTHDDKAATVLIARLAAQA